MSSTEFKHCTKKERVTQLVDSILHGSKDYAIEAYIQSTVTESIITKLIIPCDREEKLTDKQYSVEWKQGEVEFNRLVIPFDEVLNCYEDNDFGCRTVFVTMKNGMMVTLECVGLRI